MRLLCLCCCLWSLQMAAQTPPSASFPGLVTHRFDSACLGPRGVQFDPKLASAHDEFIEIPDHPAGGFRIVMRGRIDRNSAQHYELRYDDGPSCDPTFSLWLEGSDEPIGSLGGDLLTIPGNGFLYVISRSNHSFEAREKWAVSTAGLAEVPQSHYYVGVSTRTLKSVTLREQPNSTSARMARIPADEQVLVVLNQVIDGHDWYLVRTPFGLVGWTEDSGYGEERQFEAIKFVGD